MRGNEIFLVLIILILSLPVSTFAQFNDYGIKGGVQGFGLLPNTDFSYDQLKVSFLGRAFLRFELIKELDLELGAGYGRLAGEDPSESYWETSIIPADLRLLISPFDMNSINPYLYVGGGFTKWTIDDPPKSSSTNAEEDGFDPYVPIGLGFEIQLASSLLLDISGGYNHYFSDNLENNLSGDHDDGYWSLGLGLVFTGESGSSDSDLDGLTLKMEEALGTDPEEPDTDGDGLLDGLEVNQYQTDPILADSDNDGISDSEEIQNTATNPLISDTDEDGFTDGDEVNNLKTDPLRTDSDFDGISDYDEVTLTETDPTMADTDKDGLKDGDEKNKYKTHPLQTDSDKDGLSDGDEVLKYNTNPIKKDTDGGTTNDNVEIERGTNPLNPEDDVILDVEAPIVLEGVTFATGSSELTPESEKMLLKVLNTLNAYPDMKVEIRGYTDNVGKASNNQKLSQRRANSVRYWVLNKGVNPDRVIAKGYGENNPIADNNTKEGRRLNRRIEFSRIN